MSESEAAAASNSSSLGLPCPLPPAAPDEPAELAAFRAGPVQDSTFVKLRRRFREVEDWRSLATLLVIYAAHTTNAGKVAELSQQAYELWLDRVRDPAQAAHALARAVQAAPEHERGVQLLYNLYKDLGWHQERVILLRWRIREAERANPAAVSGLLVELAGILEEHFMAIKEAIAIYERALARDRRNRAAAEGLVRLYLHASSWTKAAELMTAELARLDPTSERERIAELHLRLARIEHEVNDNIAAAAVHLQSALKAMPDNVRALRAFGVMYLGSGKASDEGMAKASDIFFRAAKLANQQGDRREALKLLRRTLTLRPDHYDAGMMLAELLSQGQRWTELDDLYSQWLNYVAPEDAYSLWMQRGELLETHLARREDARICFEAATRYEAPGGPAWQRLEELYAALGDMEALAGLFESYAEQMPDSMPIDKLLKAAETYREELHNDERASFFFFKVLEREPFNAAAFEGYKEYWRRKNKWAHLRDLIFYQIDQATSYRGADNPLQNPSFAEEFVELAEICEKRLGDLDGALDAWSRLQSSYPNDWRPREQIARLDKRIRMLDSMINTQETELHRAHEPEKRLALLRRLTQAYRERTLDPARAIDHLHELLTLDPDNSQAEAALADLYGQVGDHQGLIAILRQNFEAARRPAQQMQLLRQMAALWHDDLQQHDDAIWACEQLLSYKNDDLEAIHRLENLFFETGRYDALYSALERELAITADPKAKARLLRRMGNIAETRLADNRKAARVYADLLAVDPHNLEIIDKMAAIYETTGRFDDLATLLGKAAASAKTPPIRQLDYLMRLGHVAEGMLGDPDLACSAFERVLRIHRDHRAAVEALTRLYRTISSWHGLAAMLGNLQELVDTDEEVLQLGLERAEILADNLDNASAAARVLEQLDATIAPGHPEISQRLTSYYARSGDHRKAIRHAEVLLLAARGRADRRRLYEAIASSWIALGETKNGLAAFDRYVKESGNEPEALRVQADLQEQAGDHAGAVATLDRYLSLLRDPSAQVATLERMAEISEKHQGHHKRAIALLGKALGIAPGHSGVREKLEAIAARHGMWKDLLHAYGERFNEMSQRSDIRGQIEMCLGASKTAEEQIGDYDLAFAWAKKAYFVALEAGRESREAREPRERIHALAEGRGLWAQLLAVYEQELKLLSGPAGDLAGLELLLAAADIARDRLNEPEKAIAFLQRAYALRPEDIDLAKQIEALAEKHELWPALIAFHESNLGRSESSLAQFEAHLGIARLLERKLGDAKGAARRLRTAWEQIYADDRSMAEEALDLTVSLCERAGLWAELSDLRQAAASRLFDRKAIPEGLNSLREAARIADERCGDPVAALRILRGGLPYDRQGAALFEPLRALAAKVDGQRAAGEPRLGSLTLLGALQELCRQADDAAAKVGWLKERASIRERDLEDRKGAMAEWLRILGLQPSSEEARFELERLAEAGNLWDLMLLVPAWEIQQMRAHRRPGQPPTPKHYEQEVALWGRISELYADYLARPEYALRASLCAWRLRPTLPPADGDLGPIHGSIWHLASITGTYTTPPPPRDPLLWPKVDAPEIGDDALWRRLGLHPLTLRAREDRSTAAQTPSTTIVDFSEIETVDEPPPEITGVVDFSEISEIDPLDEVVPEITGVVDISEVESVDEPPPEITGVLDVTDVSDVVELSEIEPLDEIDDDLDGPITPDLAPDAPELLELRAAAIRDADAPLARTGAPPPAPGARLRAARALRGPGAAPTAQARRARRAPPQRPSAAPERPPTAPSAAPERAPTGGPAAPARSRRRGHADPRADPAGAHRRPPGDPQPRRAGAADAPGGHQRLG
ncbi:MAG: hypothetical protein H6710_21690 [Myxococcales bacterium]|nr:hypothetical protein [Myxococcales bacterium]